MKRNFLPMVVMVISLLVLSGFSWGQCPEEPDDLGFCDTLHVVPWPETDTCFIQCYIGGCDTICINDPGEQFPSFLYVNLFVTHDSNTFWWEGGSKWVQDSLRGITVPLIWSKEGCADSIVFPTYDYWNNKEITSVPPPYSHMNRSLFRHFVDYQTGDTTHNRLLQMVENEKSAWLVYINFSADTVAISVVPMDPGCQSWWEGYKTLLATLTFQVYLGEDCDTTEICFDSAFWPPNSVFSFIRYDAEGFYVPRHNLPVCTLVSGPRIVVTSPNGGEEWVVGEVHNITWFSDKFDENVLIEYSTDGGVEWDTIMENTANDGVHPWTIPDAPSTECRVRVSDAVDQDPSDVSDENFTIVGAAAPDFTIEAKPETLTVVAGESVGCDVILDSLDGFSSSCTLTVEEDSLPASTTYDFDPTTVVPPDTSVLTFHTDISTPPGTSIIIVTGSEMSKGKNGMEHSTQVVLMVIPPPDFAIGVTPDTLEVAQGYSGDYQVILTSINGFASPCTLTVAGHPDGSTATFEDSVLTPTDTTILTIAIPDTITPNTFTLTITASEIFKGKQITHDTTVTLIVTTPTWDFKVVASPDTQIVVQGNPTTYEVTIIPNVGFTAPCTLFVENLPSGTTADFDSNPIPPNDTSTLTITTQYPTTPVGEYDLTIIAVANFKQRDTTYVKLIVQPGTDVEDEGDQLSAPDRFALFQNQPNPFNPETEISFNLPQGCEVKLSIYNILGRRVKTLFEGYQTPGMKTLVWDGRDDQGEQLGSGIYFYRLQAGEFNQTRKMTLIK